VNNLNAPGEGVRAERRSSISGGVRKHCDLVRMRDETPVKNSRMTRRTLSKFVGMGACPAENYAASAMRSTLP
jgi:hypothetical protein